MSIKIDDIAPFNMEGRIVTIKRGSVLEIGMVFKNRLVERYFAIALGPRYMWLKEMPEPMVLTGSRTNHMVFNGLTSSSSGA